MQLGAAVLFLVLVGVCAALAGASTAGLTPSVVWLFMVAANMVASMAMNIGANHVPNNMGPAAGKGAIAMGWAIAVAAVFEALGATVARGDVVGTTKGVSQRVKIGFPTALALGLVVPVVVAVVVWWLMRKPIASMAVRQLAETTERALLAKSAQPAMKKVM